MELDVRRRNRILEVLSFNFAEPKRYSEIWKYVQERREGITKHIASKHTLNKYLHQLVKEGVIVRDEKTRKNVAYVLANRKRWENIKKEYELKMSKQIEKFTNDAKNTIQKIKAGRISKEKVKGIILNAWLFYVINSTDAYCLLVDAKQFVSYVSSSILSDWVMSPFMLSAKVVEACYNKYPSETESVLKNLRNEIQKKPSG